MKNKKYLKIGLVMILIAILFVFYALNHPESSFPWSNKITYTIYVAYLALTIYFIIKKDWSINQRVPDGIKFWAFNFP